jgi:polyphenol oxidase
VFEFRDSRAGLTQVEVGFTDRSYSFAEPEPGDELPSPGAEVSLDRGWALLESGCGCPIRRMRQIHGSQVVFVDQARPGSRVGTDVSGEIDGVPEADAMMSTARGVALMSRAADCVTLLLADTETAVIAAAHCGRAGLVAGIVPAVLDGLRSRGAQRLTAWIGPHICAACYEVPELMRAEVARAVPESYAVSREGSPAVDLGAGVRAQLAAADSVEVVAVGGCTREDSRWPSHRRDGTAAGRFAGLIWMPR